MPRPRCCERVRLTENLHYALQESINSQPLRKAAHGSIPDCRKWIEEHTTVERHQFGTFTLASHFITLALVWRTFWILECAKQRLKPARDHLAANNKTWQLRKFQPGRKYHDNDLYDVKCLQVVILKSLLSRHALGRTVLASNWIHIRQ